jgi:hypothetical protein
MQYFDTRQQMVEALVPKGGVIAEVGTFEGEFLEDCYRLCAPTRLVSIDLFEGITCSGNQDGNSMKYNVNMGDVHTALLAKYKNDPKVEFYKGNSGGILRTFPDNTFDMIYIDGDHAYEGCLRDLLLSHQKIKSGGWIMGHDYDMNMEKAQTRYEFGVKQAVDEYCRDYNQSIYAKAMDGCVGYAIQVKK